LPEEKKGSPEDEEETLQRKNANPVPWALYALRPRRRSSGKGNNQLLKPHDNEKKILARSPLDKIPIAAPVFPRPGKVGAEDSRYKGTRQRLNRAFSAPLVVFA
jgi:hypothetical protein